jgi:hypothetical protein
MGLERGQLSLASTTEELLWRKGSGSGLENLNTTVGIRLDNHLSPSICKIDTNFAYKRRSLSRGLRPLVFFYVSAYLAVIKRRKCCVMGTSVRPLSRPGRFVCGSFLLYKCTKFRLEELACCCGEQQKGSAGYFVLEAISCRLPLIALTAEPGTVQLDCSPVITLATSSHALPFKTNRRALQIGRQSFLKVSSGAKRWEKERCSPIVGRGQGIHCKGIEIREMYRISYLEGIPGRPCALVVRVPDCRTEFYCAYCVLQTEFINVR